MAKHRPSCPNFAGFEFTEYATEALHDGGPTNALDACDEQTHTIALALHAGAYLKNICDHSSDDGLHNSGIEQGEIATTPLVKTGRAPVAALPVQRLHSPLGKRVFSRSGGWIINKHNCTLSDNRASPLSPFSLAIKHSR
jgi:hypothetical protein